MRVSRSAVPAPENGTTIRAGRVGQDWGCADVGDKPSMHSRDRIAARVIEARKVVGRNMAPYCHGAITMGNGLSSRSIVLSFCSRGGLVQFNPSA